MAAVLDIRNSITVQAHLMNLMKLNIIINKIIHVSHQDKINHNNLINMIIVINNKMKMIE